MSFDLSASGFFFLKRQYLLVLLTPEAPDFPFTTLSVEICSLV